MRILLAEDEQPLAKAIVKILEKNKYSADAVYDGEEALNYIMNGNYDLVILDIMMPKIDGLSVLRKVRQSGNKVPVIMLTAKSEEIDRVLGLELGADDYIVKPFSAREVVARVKAVLRRYSMQETEPAKILHYGNLEININNYDVRLNGERLPLTPKEVEILQLLASHPGKVFSREKILSIVWGYEYYGDTRAVDTQIKRIRQKLQSADDCGWEIKTVYGVGYRFEAYGDPDDRQDNEERKKLPETPKAYDFVEEKPTE